MPLERFAGNKMTALLGDARRVFGPDAIAVATRARLGEDGGRSGGAGFFHNVYLMAFLRAAALSVRSQVI